MRILRRPAVQAKTGLPCSTMYQFIATGEFPRPINLGKRAVGWLESDIDQWIENRASAADEGSANLPVPPSDLVEQEGPEDQILDAAEVDAERVRYSNADRTVRRATRAKSR